MDKVFILSFATEPNGFLHKKSEQIPAEKSEPDFAKLPEEVYYVTLMGESGVITTWKKDRITLKFFEQDNFRIPFSGE
jgi:hypothetical protein